MATRKTTTSKHSAAAVEAARQCGDDEPTLLNGMRVPVIMTATVQFPYTAVCQAASLRLSSGPSMFGPTTGQARKWCRM